MRFSDCFAFIRKKKAGQGTIEYILITTVVVGVVLTIFNGPLKKFLSSYTSRKQEYTNVVSQRTLGIPMAWFGGNFPDPGGGTATGGPGPDDPTDPQTSPPSPPGSPTGAQPPGSQSPDSGYTPGEVPGPSPGAGPARNAGNNSLLSSENRNNSNNSRNSRGRNGAGSDEDANGEATESSGSGIGRRGANDVAADGSTVDKDEKSDAEKSEDEEKNKNKEGGETFRNEKELFGQDRKRVREGNCGDLDLKVILQIAFVIGLFFMLASMLFQKRDK